MHNISCNYRQNYFYFVHFLLLTSFSVITASKLTQTVLLTSPNFSTTLLLRRFFIHFSGSTINMTAAQTTAATLDNLMSHDQATGESKSLERPWHGAEGVHFYLLAHRQLYDGEVEAGKRKDFHHQK